jgi:hypothetical protein
VIPDHEADRITDTVMDAVDAAGAFRLAEGHDLFLAGLRRARELLNQGEPYAVELVHWWRGAVQNDCDSQGVPLE